MKQGCEDSKEKRELFDHNYHGKDLARGSKLHIFNDEHYGLVMKSS